MAEKIYSELEFLKSYISYFNSSSACSFCKYNPANYKDMNNTIAKINRANKCANCTSFPFNISFKGKQERKLFDNFKPLYGWENIDKE